VIPVLDARRMRAADRAAIRGGVPSARLMENAAASLVQELLRLIPGAQSAVAVCGPGNNGGDGLAAARLLAERGVSVAVFTLGDPDSYRGDAAANASRARAAGLELLPLSRRGANSAFRRELAKADIVVDALFGTGLTRALSGLAARAVHAINATGRPVVSADLPSGLSADMGNLLGPAVRASLTVAFAAAKPAHVFFPARGFCGRVVVRDIGIPRKALLARARPLALAEARDVRAWLPPRPADSHKGDFGRLAVIAGSRGKAGAAVLTARGALRAGAGLVTVFCPASIESLVVSALPEAMTRGLPERDGALAEEASGPLLEALEGFDAAVAGPGLGTARGTVRVIEALIGAACPLVFDADALNALAARPRAFSRRRAETVLTPHPGEAGRLLATTSAAVQKDRLAAGTRLARRSRGVVLLKGAASLICAPSGRVTVNPTGTPLMSTAGSGDVLAGAVGALLAGGLNAERAAIAAAYLHGSAGELLSRILGDAGLLARELADALPVARAALRAIGC
jgi:ADP-dependent NAD(P)H-hydrate dehydratase / NAD(P)H-hydrate epimerase